MSTMRRASAVGTASLCALRWFKCPGGARSGERAGRDKSSFPRAFNQKPGGPGYLRSRVFTGESQQSNQSRSCCATCSWIVRDYRAQRTDGTSYDQPSRRPTSLCAKAMLRTALAAAAKKLTTVNWLLHEELSSPAPDQRGTLVVLGRLPVPRWASTFDYRRWRGSTTERTP